MGIAAASAGAVEPFKDYRPDGVADVETADVAAESTGAAVPTRDYGPDGAADGLSLSTPRQADDTTMLPFGSGLTRQYDARDSKLSHYLPNDRHGSGGVLP
jgi:hypothetical protein